MVAMAEPQQYTSGQILAAARRAEAEGKLDYALQFYRHIVDHHSSEPEAQEARASYVRLFRLRRSADDPEAAGFVPPAHVNGAPSPVRAAAGAAIQEDAAEAAPAGGAPGGTVNLPQVVAAAERQALYPLAELEFAFKERYRAGTVISLGANWVGWLLVGVGVALAGAGLFGVTGGLADPSPAVFDLPLGLVYGLGATMGGLALVFLSQIALAIFDNANASRHLLAIERAKAEL